MNSNPTDRAVVISSIVVAAGDQVSTDLGSEQIILSLRTGMYHGVGEVAGRIWELVRQPVRVSDVRDAIAKQYDIDVARVERDVLAFLGQLASEGLIDVRNDAETAR